MSDGSTEIQTVGAIRLALEGAANDESALTLVKWLVDQAPETQAADTESARLLLEGIRSLGFSISTESASGAYSPA